MSDFNPNRIYRGAAASGFGLWREFAPGRWVFGMPVAGFTWRHTYEPDRDRLVPLTDDLESELNNLAELLSMKDPEQYTTVESSLAWLLYRRGV